jgi:hypothetical protein
MTRLTHDRPDLSSERAPQKWQDCNFKKKKSLVKSPIFGLDTKTYWLTDRQSQCDFDFDLREWCLSPSWSGTYSVEPNRWSYMHVRIYKSLHPTCVEIQVREIVNSRCCFVLLALWTLFMLVWPPLWSSGQSSWLQIQRSGFDSQRYQISRERNAVHSAS